MAKTVAEIMNRQLFVVRPEDECDRSIARILLLGISGAPVVDTKDHRVLFVA